jgi:hypothetical protein
MSKTITVWRVEHRTSGLGPFNSDCLDATEHKLHFMDYDKYPSPKQDTGIGRPIRNSEYCACASIEQLRHWFGDPEIRKHLNMYDCVILKLEVEKHRAVIGEKQVLVTRIGTHLVKEYKFSSLNRIRG